MSKDQKQICTYCKWWSPNTTTDLVALYGQCRVGAPIADSEGAGLWPTTGADDWCGKFQDHDDRAARLLGTKYMTDGEAA